MAMDTSGRGIQYCSRFLSNPPLNLYSRRTQKNSRRITAACLEAATREALHRPRPLILVAVAMQLWDTGTEAKKGTSSRIYFKNLRPVVFFLLLSNSPSPHLYSRRMQKNVYASPAVVKEDYIIRKEEEGEADRGALVRVAASTYILHVFSVLFLS